MGFFKRQSEISAESFNDQSIVKCSRDDCESTFPRGDLPRRIGQDAVCSICRYIESREFPPEKGHNFCPNPTKDYSGNV